MKTQSAMPTSRTSPKFKQFAAKRSHRGQTTQRRTIESMANTTAPRNRRINSTTTTKNVRCEMSIVPIRLDQSPGEIGWSSGCSVDEAGATLSIIVDREEHFAGRSLVIGANFSGSAPAFAPARILNQWRVDGKLRIETTLINDDSDEVLSPAKLMPRIDPVHLRFHHGLAPDLLDQWESIGIIRRYLVDRILTCPECHSIPTWRKGCSQCGSARFESAQMIHHFACAHVGPAESFHAGDAGINCPKCRSNMLIAGTDFQYSSGPMQCLDCHKSGCQPTLCCMCHCCMQRFTPDDALEHEVHGYHFDRLDLLDLVAASQ